MRQKSLMPPFSSIAKLTISDIKKEVAFKKAKEVQRILLLALEKLGLAQNDSCLHSCHFAPAFFPRTHGKYHFHVFLKAPTKKELVSFLKKQTLPDGVKIDIDPSSLL